MNTMLTRMLEAMIALGVIAAVLPLILLAAAGLKLAGVSPVFTTLRIHGSDVQPPCLAFNATTTPFGLFLRRYSIDQLPALFQVVIGKARLRAIWRFALRSR